MKAYLGDSVYATSGDYGVLLTTENGLPTDPSNSIWMEAEVIERFIKFVKRVTEDMNEAADAQKEES